MEKENLIISLDNCINHCNHCSDACLDEEDVHMMVNCIRTDRACAVVCTALKNLLTTNYSNVSGLVKYCIDICNACADECEKHDEVHCRECAKACRECAQACTAFLN